MGADDLKTTLSKPLLSENEYREMVNSVETELDIKELIRVGHVTLTLLLVHVIMMYSIYTHNVFIFNFWITSSKLPHISSLYLIIS